LTVIGQFLQLHSRLYLLL